MKILRSLIVLSLVAAAWPFVSRAQTAQTKAAALFQEGLTLERAEGKLKDAIFRYERVVAEFPADRDVAPRALYQLVLAYERLSNPRATLLLTRLVTEYPSSSPYAGDARKKLAALQGGPAVAPFKTAAIDEQYESGSPDGRLVVYYKNDAFDRLYLRDLAAGAERLLVDSDGQISNFAWSPDSTRLAFNFQHAAEKIHEIRIVTVATGEVRRHAARGYPASWTSKDEIFFYRPNYAGGVVEWSFVAAAGGEPRLAHAAKADTSWCCAVAAADGSRLLVSTGKKLAVLELATGVKRPLTSGSGEEEGVQVSPDYRLAAFRSNEDGEWALYVARLDQRPATPVRIASIGDTSLRTRGTWWTHTGLLTYRPVGRDSNVYRINMDPKTGHATAPPQRLTQDATENWIPVVSTDSRHIAYWFRNGAKVGLAVMDSLGTGERPLIERGVILQVSWRSPDEILFYDPPQRAGEKSAITSLDIRTGALQRLAEIEGLYWRWVPGRNEILHFYPGGGGPKLGAVIKARSLADGRDRVVASIDYLAPKFAVSADGTRIAYVVAPPGAPAQCELALMGIDGTREKTLIPAGQPCMGPSAWSPDGRFLIVSGDASHRVMDVATAESWPLHDEIADWDLRSWAPDGSFVVMSRGTTRSERFAWEGVTYDAVVRLLKTRGQ